VKTIYLDTNVFLKLFFEEALGKEQAEEIIFLAKQNKATIAISQWVLNECVAAVEKKKKEGKMGDREASEVLTGIADLVEGQIEEISLSLYPITEQVIIGSRATMMEINCEYATDALHLYVADKANCNYFVTADNTLYITLSRSRLKMKLIPINLFNDIDMSRLLAA